MLKTKKLWLDRENNRFRIIVSFFGFTVGEWKSLSDIQFIGITRVKFSKTVSSPKLSGNVSCTTNFSDYKYCVFLCESVRKKTLVFKGSYEESQELVKEVSGYLEMKIVDFTI